MPNTDNRLLLFVSILLAAAWFFWPVTNVCAATDATAQLEAKMNQIIELQKNLSEKAALAENSLRQLEEMLSGLAAEIQDERLQSGVLTYDEAVRHQSLNNRLKLAQQLISYIEQLKSKIDTFRDGNRQLSFLYQEATDDIKIIQTLSHLRLDDFIVRSDRVIGYLKSELEQHLVRADRIRYEHTSDTWEAVITRN